MTQLRGTRTLSDMDKELVRFFLKHPKSKPGAELRFILEASK